MNAASWVVGLIFDLAVIGILRAASASRPPPFRPSPCPGGGSVNSARAWAQSREAVSPSPPAASSRLRSLTVIGCCMACFP